MLHALLERLNFRAPVAPTPEAVRAAALAAGLRGPGPREVEELIGTVERFAASSLRSRLARIGDARREQRFAFLWSGVLITGAIDVLAREPGGRALIVDYKSDRIGAENPERIVSAAYGTQRLIYALAALHAGAGQVEVAYCFLESPEVPVTMTYTGSDRPGLEAELAARAGGVLRHEFPVADAPHRALCAGCPAEGGLCSWPLDATRREWPDRLF